MFHLFYMSFKVTHAWHSILKMKVVQLLKTCFLTLRFYFSFHCAVSHIFNKNFVSLISTVWKEFLLFNIIRILFNINHILFIFICSIFFYTTNNHITSYNCLSTGPMRPASACLCLAWEYVTITCLFLLAEGKQDIMRISGRCYMRNETYQMCLSHLLSYIW